MRIRIDSFKTIYQCMCITESFITHTINPSKTLQSHPEWPSLLLPENLHQTHGSDCTANPCPLFQNINCQTAIGASTQTSAEFKRTVMQRWTHIFPQHQKVPNAALTEQPNCRISRHTRFNHRKDGNATAPFSDTQPPAFACCPTPCTGCTWMFEAH